MKHKIRNSLIFILVLAVCVCSGCSRGQSGETPPLAAVVTTPDAVDTEPLEAAAPRTDETPEEPGTQETDVSMEIIPLTEKPAMFELLLPAATGTDVISNEKAVIDVSNKRDGYVMIRYLEETTQNLVVTIKGQSGVTYQYLLDISGEYDVYPLSDGNGTYVITVLEGAGGNRYSIATTGTIDVELIDEFAPFLRPNQYVNYNADNKTVKLAAELTNDSADILNKIAKIYDYVITNISYDTELAERVKAGEMSWYLPDIDAVLASGKGICFDYAAVFTAMLRSQGIPTKLVVGYTGEVYHAWISTYSTETGWIDSVIYFDGVSWKLMDPTYASSGNQNSDVMQYIGNGANYQEKYLY